MTPFAQRFADRRLQIAFDPSIQSFHSILPFESLTPQKKNEVLYKSSPGFEPTTFLIHDLSWELMTQTARPPWVDTPNIYYLTKNLWMGQGLTYKQSSCSAYCAVDLGAIQSCFVLVQISVLLFLVSMSKTKQIRLQ